MTTTRLSFGSFFGKRAAVLFWTALIAGTGSALAQEPTGPGTLEELVVTAQRHEQNVQDVPVSVSSLSGERLNAMFEGSGDIRELATRVPSLYAESSNGRLAPRFYIRGLGNTDFDLAASQPVSIIVDDVVLENVVLKSFPLFDIDRVEVLRGPQGTLFGRNNPGIVNFTVKPKAGFDGDVGLPMANSGTTTVKGRSAAAQTGFRANRPVPRAQRLHRQQLSILGSRHSDWKRRDRWLRGIRLSRTAPVLTE
jgi:iron complex outermembrane receptor protein